MFVTYFKYKAFIIKKSSKIFIFKKLKDFIGIGRPHMPFKLISRPLKYIFLQC